MANYMEQVRNRLLGCQRGLSEIELRNFMVWAKLKKAQAACPDILEEFTAGGDYAPGFFFSQAECQKLFQGHDLLVFEAQAELANLLCAEAQAAAGSVVAAGTYTEPDDTGAFTIPVPGLQAGDVAFVIVSEMSGSAYVAQAEVNVGLTGIDVVLSESAIGISVSWVVIRPGA